MLLRTLLLGVCVAPAVAQGFGFVPLYQGEVDGISPNYIWGPNRALAVDFDGDGDRDLVSLIGNLFAGVIQLDISSNDGRGAFSPRAVFSLTAEPRDVAYGDVDGDGLADLYVSFPQDEDRVYFGTGWPTFPFANPAPVPGISSGWIDLADLDGDGDLDVVNTESSFVEIHWNDGQGNFLSGPPRAVYGVGNQIRLFDADGDGDVDALARASSTQAAVLLRNDGAGTWTQDPTPVAAGIFSGGAIVDADVDGDLDVLLLNAGTLTFHANDGTGNFGTPVSAGSFPAWPIRGEMEVGDVDLDGIPDLAFGSFEEVAHWRGQGDGTFVDATVSSGLVPPQGVIVRPRQVILDELDGVPGADVFVLDAPRGRMWRNDGAGAFEALFPAQIASGVQARAADLDGDGIDDLVQVADRATGVAPRLEFLRGVGDGSFEDVTASWLPPLRAAVTAYDLEDVDGDGDVDAVVCLENPAEFVLLRNDGPGVFVSARSQVMPAFGAFVGIAVGDVDGDGRPLDLVASAGSGPNETFAFRDEPTGWQSALFLPFMPAGAQGPDLVDVDNDGDVDLTLRSSPYPLLRNDGAGNLSIDAALSGTNVLDTAFGDLTGDGVMELVIGGGATPMGVPFPAEVRVFNGSSWSVAQTLDPVPGPQFVDVDDDGDLDLTLGGPVGVYLNVGGQALAPLGPIAFVGVTNLNYLPGDFDGDGDVDFAYTFPNSPLGIVQNTTRRFHAPLPADRGFPFSVELTTRQTGGVLALIGISGTADKVTLPFVGVRHLGLSDLWFTPVALAPQVDHEVRFDVPNLPALGGMTFRTQAAFLESAGPRLSGFRELTIR